MTRLTSNPIGVTATWLNAVEDAYCQCQCTTAVKGHTHARAGGRCPTTQGVNGGRLHLLADHAVLCGPCATHHEKHPATDATAPAQADPAESGQGSLFDLSALRTAGA